MAFALISMPFIGRDTDYDDDIGTDLERSNTALDGGVWYASGFAGLGMLVVCLLMEYLGYLINSSNDDQHCNSRFGIL